LKKVQKPPLYRLKAELPLIRWKSAMQHWASLPLYQLKSGSEVKATDGPYGAGINDGLPLPYQ